MKETLQRLQLEPERLQLTQLAIDEWDKLPALFDGFVNRIRESGSESIQGVLVMGDNILITTRYRVHPRTDGGGRAAT